MRKLKSIGLSAAVLMLALGFTASIPIFALSGSGDSGTETSHKSGSERVAATETETNDQPGTPEAAETGEVSSSTELHRRGDNLLADAKKNHADDKAKTAEQRQKVCESHKQGISNKFSHIVTNSKKIQAKIDGIYAKALAFQQSSNSTPAGFSDLTTAADTAKANSAASIAALQAITPTIDCNNTSVASDIATFKAAAQQTRDNLKAYRTAVKAVVKSLETVKTTTEGSN